MKKFTLLTLGAALLLLMPATVKGDPADESKKEPKENTDYPADPKRAETLRQLQAQQRELQQKLQSQQEEIKNIQMMVKTGQSLVRRMAEFAIRNDKIREVLAKNGITVQVSKDAPAPSEPAPFDLEIEKLKQDIKQLEESCKKLASELEQARQVHSHAAPQLEKLANDLLDAAKTDKDAQAIVDQFGSNVTNQRLWAIEIAQPRSAVWR